MTTSQTASIRRICSGSNFAGISMAFRMVSKRQNHTLRMMLNLLVSLAFCIWIGNALGLSVLTEEPKSESSCTVSATGGDDGPSFLNAVKTCSTTIIPSGTTLSIGSNLNMTGLSNKHIVCTRTFRLTVAVFDQIRHPQSLKGTIKFTDDIPYWTGVSFFNFYDSS